MPSGTRTSSSSCASRRNLEHHVLDQLHENAGTRATLHKIGQTCRLTRYAQLTQVESVFRSLKSELGIRPIYHQLEHRADAHVLIAFLAYCLQVTLKNRLLI